MRFCDLLKEDLASLLELPESTTQITEGLQAYQSIVWNCRCLFLALCHWSVGKGLEAASLLDLLHARIEDVALGDALPEPLARLHPLLERVHEALPTRVARWRCRNLANLATQVAKQAQEPQKEAQAVAPPTSQAAIAELGLDDFPPKVRDIPCKPLLFDLAFACIAMPELDHLMPKGRDGGDDAGEEKKGLLARAATGLGSRISGLGGLWGRK